MKTFEQILNDQFVGKQVLAYEYRSTKNEQVFYNHRKKEIKDAVYLGALYRTIDEVCLSPDMQDEDNVQIYLGFNSDETCLFFNLRDEISIRDTPSKYITVEEDD
jgi:hypothetical protein